MLPLLNRREHVGALVADGRAFSQHLRGKLGALVRFRNLHVLHVAHVRQLSLRQLSRRRVLRRLQRQLLHLNLLLLDQHLLLVLDGERLSFALLMLLLLRGGRGDVRVCLRHACVVRVPRLLDQRRLLRLLLKQSGDRG